MNNDYNEQLNLQSKLAELEDTLGMVCEQLRQTQRHMIKIAEYQANLAKKISNWPYVAVET